MKVKLVAIAKDEGLYLPEWISYHLMIGVSHVHVILNKINDASELICGKIAKKYPVTYEFGDDLLFPQSNEHDGLIDANFLKRNTLQSRAFAKAYSEANSEEFDYILYVDIDEFLYVTSGRIEHIFNKFEDFDFLMIKTFLALGQDEFCLPCIRQSIGGTRHQQTKFLIRTGLNGVKFHSTHMAVTPNASKRYFAGYGVIDNKMNRPAVWSDDVCVIHHYFRSPVEYLSLLARGDTFVNTKSGLKLNRPGWQTGLGQPLTLADDFVQKADQSYQALVEEAGISDLLEFQKLFVQQRAKMVEKHVTEVVQEYKNLKKICSGTALGSKFK